MIFPRHFAPLSRLWRHWIQGWERYQKFAESDKRPASVVHSPIPPSIGSQLANEGVEMVAFRHGWKRVRGSQASKEPTHIRELVFISFLLKSSSELKVNNQFLGAYGQQR